VISSWPTNLETESQAVDAAKTGGQDVGVGDVFVKVTEKKQLPYLGFSRRGGIRVWWAKTRLQEENVLKHCNSEIKSLGYYNML
jgi:hypothetical protein